MAAGVRGFLVPVCFVIGAAGGGLEAHTERSVRAEPLVANALEVPGGVKTMVGGRCGNRSVALRIGPYLRSCGGGTVVVAEKTRSPTVIPFPASVGGIKCVRIRCGPRAPDAVDGAG